jgi:hypothetical protein
MYTVQQDAAIEYCLTYSLQNPTKFSNEYDDDVMTTHKEV